MKISEDRLFCNGITGLNGAEPDSFIAQYLIGWSVRITFIFKFKDQCTIILETKGTMFSIKNLPTTHHKK